ncbi:hypothetical protein E5288_WYG011817 [Bos mutus]|uniref:Uncharacterized protein n=1 Tax=Bos mutus TaxID=72004 RepID=A0A6B0RS55_9CETA|nr:hypothetical protein [Bos mutus]
MRIKTEPDIKGKIQNINDKFSSVDRFLLTLEVTKGTCCWSLESSAIQWRWFRKFQQQVAIREHVIHHNLIQGLKLPLFTGHYKEQEHVLPGTSPVPAVRACHHAARLSLGGPQSSECDSVLGARLGERRLASAGRTVGKRGARRCQQHCQQHGLPGECRFISGVHSGQAFSV